MYISLELLDLVIVVVQNFWKYQIKYENNCVSQRNIMYNIKGAQSLTATIEAFKILHDDKK